MAIRNFWIEADINGKKIQLKGGPIRKDGGFKMNIYMRSNGKMINPITITGSREGDNLKLRIIDEKNGTIVFKTKR